ncbi:MAG: hypothetical protein L3J35_03670 [Bacteroidales bacterium]|nr:hypothetical protein [Bacteroidales bacterium]
MNTLEQIIEIIKLNKKPYISLKRKDGLSTVSVGYYKCDNCDKDDNIETKLDKAIKWFTDYVKLFPQGTVFYIYLKSSENANQSGIIGAFEFMNGEPEKNEENINGLGGIPGYDNLKQLGYIPEAEVKAKLLEKEIEFQRELNKREIEDLKKDFTEKLELIQQTAASWSPERISGLAKEIGLAFRMISGKEVAETTLAGADDKEKEKQTPADNLKVASINELAEILYENASLKDIENIKKIIAKPEQKPEQNG